MKTLFLNLFLALKNLIEYFYIPFIFEFILLFILVFSFFWKRKKKKRVEFRNHEYLKILRKYKEKLEDCSIDCNKKMFIFDYLLMVERNLNEAVQKFEKYNFRRADDIRKLFDEFFYAVSQDFEFEMLGKQKNYDEVQDFIRTIHEELDVMKNEIALICLSDSYATNDLKMCVILDIVLTFIIININKLEV